MEVVLYNSTVCRLCGEENDNGTFLYSTEENNQNISDLVNAYLPIKVSDDGQLPRTICPGCTIQLEATVEFINLIVTGQKAIRSIYQREKEYKKNLNKTVSNDSDTVITEVDPAGAHGVYQEEHPISLQVAGLDKPRRKRGRPPKKVQSQDEQALEAAAIEQKVKMKQKDEEPTGKRRRKTPERFREVVQGKELDQIFREEGMTDGEESDSELKAEKNKMLKEQAPKAPEVIGHTVSGELVMIVKGKGRGRPKGRTKQTHETCAICGKDFSNSGRYMSHIAQHGPVLYQCQQCAETFPIRLDFNNHQQETNHEGLNVLPCPKDDEDNNDILAALKFYSHGTYQRSGAQSSFMSMCQPSFCTCLDEITNALSSPDIVLKYIKFPSRRDEREAIMTKFMNKHGIPGVIGCIDGTHVAIIRPIEFDEAYYNSKAYHSLNVMLESSQAELTTSQPDLETPPELFSTPELVEKVDETGLPDSQPQILNVEFIKDLDASESEVNKEVKSDVKDSPNDDTPRKHKLKCPHCDKKYSSKQAKSMHIKAVHKGERPYICSECGAAFAYPRALTLHMLAHRRKNTSKGFACDLCGKVLNHPSSVAYHKEAEHANQQYVCNKCGKNFKHKQLLQRHQLVHTQLRPFLCKVCNAKFKTKANLINHQMLHTGIKKFSCDECKQRFAHKTSLTLHMRWHRGQKPYGCKICDKAFTQKGNLSEHMRIHTGEKPFQCALCPRKFTTSSQHRLHLRRHEPKAHRIYPPQRIQPFEETTTIVSEDGSLIHLTINSNDVTSSTEDNNVANVANTGGIVTEAAASPCVAFRAPRPSNFPCQHCPRIFGHLTALNKHKKQVHKQTSLLAVQPTLLPLHKALTEAPLHQLQDPQYVVETEDEEERVIYVTYDVDSQPSDYQIMEPEQAEVEMESPKGCELYSGESLLLQPKQIEQEHMSVTDEEGNPLHFTMQDGTRLAITSLDGQSLQVITQDGQTIPVEINGFPQDGEESSMQDVSVQQVNLKDDEPSSPVTHYYTIV